jgi:hypothetical protein
MIIGEIAPLNQLVSLSTSDSICSIGRFTNHSFPFATFILEDSGDEIFINLDHIVTVLVFKETNDDNGSAPTGG